jgi:cobalamin-independent methionine synthase catalytic subunit
MRQERRQPPLFAKHRTDKKIGIGVVNHCNTVVEPPAHVARLIRKALEYIPRERLVISTDCGFGREGLSRRIAYYKCVALVEGTNSVRREPGLPEARVRAADPLLYTYTTMGGIPPSRWYEGQGFLVRIPGLDPSGFRNLKESTTWLRWNLGISCAQPAAQIWEHASR